MLLTQLQTRAGAAGRIIWDVSVDSLPPEAPPEPQLHTVMGGHSAGARICRRECIARFDVYALAGMVTHCVEDRGLVENPRLNKAARLFG